MNGQGNIMAPMELNNVLISNSKEVGISNQWGKGLVGVGVVGGGI
jgi:hypothetical protein